MNRMLTLLLLALLTISVSAQTTVYPVQTITTIAPPAPLSLEDMYTGAADRVVVQVVVGDASIVNYPVKFKITIAGRGIEISTSPAFNPDPVLLNGGETQLFNGTDLARYFDPANLIFRGYSEAQYRKTGRLPEGAYRLTVDVVDYNRNVTVSKSLAAGQMFIFENEPPLLNFPMKDELLSALMPQNILFSWTPRQNPYSSPTFVPEYKFELWEIWPEDKNPNEIVRSTEPIYTVNVQTPSFLYTVNEPLLFTGRQYVWRIQVVDPEGIVQFKQKGYSEIRLFRFGKFCPVPEPEIEKTGPAHIALKWEGDSRITKYDVRYRIKKSKNREWYSKSTPFLGVDIDNLKANTAYEFQVCAYCDDQPGEYSPILTASTREETKFQCGATPPNPLLDNTNPLDKLGPRDIIRAGDFDVMVASASGSGGNFSGKGWVLVPYLKFIKIEVEFSNISVNDEYRLTAGEIKTVYNIDNAMVARVGDLSFLYSDKPKAVEDNDFVKVTNHIYRPDSTITSISISNGVVTIKTDNGQEIQVRAENKGIVAVAPKDETSTQYVADTKTNTVYSATPETNKGNASATNAVPQPKQNNTQYKVEFLAHPQEEAGTDYPNDKRPAGNYETIQLDGKAVLVPWKSMEAAKYDRLVARISGGPADTVRYRRQSEVMVMTAPMSNADGDKLNKSTAASGYKQLLLSSLGQMDEDKLYAWYPEYETVNDTLKRQNRVLAGQMNLASYDKLALNVYLVSVNGSAIPNDKDIQDALNAIYKPAVVTWTVNKLDNLLVTLKNGQSKKLDISDRTDKMEYTAEMDKVIAVLKKQGPYTRNNYYLFFFDGFIDAPGKTTPAGYMPYNCNFGFISNASAGKSQVNTVAHELGHGAFRLKHVFLPDVPYPQTEGTSDNLMDYTSDKNATALIKYQWDEVHDRDLGLNLFEDAEEGAMKGTNDNIALFISKQAQSLSEQLKTNVYAVIHISKCTDATKSKPLTDKTINNFSASDIEQRKPVLLNLHVDKDYKLWTVLYFTVEGENKLTISLPTSSNNDFSGQINKTPFLGYSIPPYERVIECTAFQNDLDAFACNSSEEYFASFDKQDRVNIYISLLLTSINKCLEEQKNDKVGDQFYREFASKATTAEESQQLRQIADVFNGMGDALLKNNNTEGWKENGDFFRSSYEVYKQLGYSFDDYLAKINGYLSLYEQKKAILEKYNDSERIALAVNAFSDKEIEYLPVTLRSKCLISLASERMTGSFNLFGHNEEYTALRLIKYIQNKDIKDFLTKLENKTNDKALIVALRERIDDGIFGIGGDNFQKLIKETRELVNKSSDLQERLASLVNADNFDKRLMQWQVSQEVIGAIKVSDVTLSDDGSLTIKRREIKGFSRRVVAPDGTTVRETDWEELPETPLKPFDLVIFVNNSNLDIINETTGTGNGEFTIVPALFLDYADQKQFNNDVVQAVSMAADVATIAVSGGTLTVAKNLTKLRKAWLLFETINSGVNLTINLTGIANDPKYKEIVDAYNKITCLLAIGELSYSGAKNLPSLIKKAQKAADATTEAIKNAAQNLVDVLNKVDASKLSASAKTGYAQLLEFAEKLKVKYGIAAIKIADKSIDELKALWNSLSDLPAKTPKKTYTLYRRVNKDWEPAVTHPAQILNDGNRYSKGREAIYFGTSKEVTDAEWLAYNPKNGLKGEYGSKLYKFEIEETDLLDLSKTENLGKLGINQSLITEIDNKIIPQELGDWAFKKGYKGVIFPSARKADESNIVLFKYFTGNTPPSIKSTILLETIE